MACIIDLSDKDLMKLLSPRTLALFSSISLITPIVVLADDNINLGADTNSQFYNLTTLRPSAYVKTAINVLLGGAGVLAFLYLLIGGLQWITAGSDKDAVEKSRRKIVQALTGLAIVFSVYAIIFIIRVLFQVDLLQFNITNLGNN